MATAKDIINELQRMFPESLEEEWDRTEGLVSGNINTKVNNIILALEFRNGIQDKKADMIIVHHPPIFGHKKQVTNPFYKKNMHNNKVVYAIHSRLDKTGFANKALAEKLFGAFKYDIFKILSDGTVIIELDKPLTKTKIINNIKNKLMLKAVNAITKKGKIKRIAIHGGEGFNQHHVIAASKEGIDLYLGGDMSHHLAEHAHFFNVNFIDIFHFSEQEGMRKLTKVLSERFPKVNFTYVKQMPLWSTR
jgi:dinuclear metal center YbgI/SA1388 family protein